MIMNDDDDQRAVRKMREQEAEIAVQVFTSICHSEL